MDHANVENGNWVIMHDRDFSSTKIKKQLEMHTDKKIRCYPSECGQEDINDLYTLMFLVSKLMDLSLCAESY